MNEDIIEQARGRWAGILAHFGLEAILSGKHQRCPICGGKDRFRWDNKDDRGMYFCNHCGAGDGVKLLMEKNGWDFKTTLFQVKHVLPGTVVMAQERRTTDRTELAKRIWQQSKPIREGDDVQRYLTRRGLTNIPPSIRIANIPYYDEGKKIGNFNAMVASIKNAEGVGVSLHATYLSEGRKAQVPSVKKIVAPGIKGGAARLFQHTDELCITEGIETALAVHELTGKPVWAALNTGNMEAVVIPKEVKRVHIYCDNDANYAGQKAAYTLANRLSLADKDVVVMCPSEIGTDWADVRFAEIAQTFPFAAEKLDEIKQAGCDDARILSATEEGREIGKYCPLPRKDDAKG